MTVRQNSSLPRQSCFFSGLWALLLCARACAAPMPFILYFDLWLAGALLIHAACIDARVLRLPDIYTLSSSFPAFVYSSLVFGWEFAVSGALAGFGLLKSYQLYFRFFKSREVIGSGDAKLMLSIGTLVGPLHCCFVMIGACLAFRLYKLPGCRRDGIMVRPFGPYLIGAGLLCALLQPAFM